MAEIRHFSLTHVPRDRELGLKDLPPEERGAPINIYAIHAMLLTWRAWRQVIIDHKTQQG